LRHIRGSKGIVEPLVRPVLTVGNFDGIHLGHRAILETVVTRAHAVRGDAVVYTFAPHPRKVLRPQQAPRLLTTLEQKLELLEAAGVDAVVVEPFSTEFAQTPADLFIREIIHGRIRPVEVYVGYDFHFGRDREGSMRMLTEMGPRLGFAVTIIPEVTIEAGDVNSTRIRQLLGEASVERANVMPAAASASPPRTSSPRTRCFRRLASTRGGYSCWTRGIRREAGPAWRW
jgi:riboflavin kinase/FMN adenylyltransferase